MANSEECPEEGKTWKRLILEGYPEGERISFNSFKRIVQRERFVKEFSRTAETAQEEVQR